MSKPLLILGFILAHSVLGTSVVLAVQYEPLIEIPGVGANLDAQTYIRTLYIFAIGVAAFVAVGRLVLAGFTYVTSSIVTEKSNAKKDVTNAILGLIIILAATTILTTINPSISNLPALTDIEVPDPFKERVEVVEEVNEPEGSLKLVCRTPDEAGSPNCNPDICQGTWLRSAEDSAYGCFGTLDISVVADETDRSEYAEKYAIDSERDEIGQHQQSASTLREYGVDEILWRKEIDHGENGSIPRYNTTGSEFRQRCADEGGTTILFNAIMPDNEFDLEPSPLIAYCMNE